jgi:thiamine-phosphate pyrophosphorylase
VAVARQAPALERFGCRLPDKEQFLTQRIAMIFQPWTYYITDRKSSPLPLLECLRRAFEAEIDFIQIREKDMPAKELFRIAQQARQMAAGRHTRILIHDRLDVALAANLDGVHLGRTSIPVNELRKALGHKDFLVGVSTHSVEEILEAGSQGADYVTFGPVFYTSSKAAYGPPIGVKQLRRATQSTSLPILALGGIDAGHITECLEAGAHGIAAIRLFQDTMGDLKKLALKIKSTIR